MPPQFPEDEDSKQAFEEPMNFKELETLKFSKFDTTPKETKESFISRTFINQHMGTDFISDSQSDLKFENYSPPALKKYKSNRSAKKEDLRLTLQEGANS